MKKLPIILFLLSAALAQGSLISLASWKFSDPLPQAFIEFALSKKPFVFFDEARVNPPGWVSQFGSLNGGKEFKTDLFSGGPLDNPKVSWDFGTSGLFMRYVSLWGVDEEGAYWNRLYQVPYHVQFSDTEFVQLNPAGTGQVMAIAFYGNSIFNLPDSGPTALLLGLSLVALALITKTKKENKLCINT